MKRHFHSGWTVAVGVVAGCAAPASAPQPAPATTAATVATRPPAATAAAAPKLTGNLVRGGLLYDTWWEVIEAQAPTGDHPLWKTQTTNTRKGADTWRCKECHGWDYKGKDGDYGSGSHKTGFPGLLSAASKPADELTAWLTGNKNPDHDFSKVLDETLVKAMVTFIQKEMKDVTPYINADKSVKGDPAKGKVKFNATCAACHGNDGKKINFGDEKTPEYIGTLAVDNPWEFFHKVVAGQPGEPMPSGLGMGWTLEDVANIAAFAQTLPTK